MFVLAKFRDIIRVPACKLGHPIEEVLAEELNKRFANKVVLNVGLVICLNNIVDVGESYIYCGDGAIHTRCLYQMIVFRPQVGEILCGTLKSSSKEGLNISLGFFDSIIIPPHNLNEPSHFNEIDQSWTWDFEDEGQTHTLTLEIGEQVRFRVHSEEFVDVSPHGPTHVSNTPLIPTELEHKEIPYTIVGTIGESGLGLVKWWK
jgi:DNA-directed RNA polymerase III subunit RPC8